MSDMSVRKETSNHIAMPRSMFLIVINLAIALIISGIGFLGAGAVLHSHGFVMGLTTIWGGLNL